MDMRPCSGTGPDAQDGNCQGRLWPECDSGPVHPALTSSGISGTDRILYIRMRRESLLGVREALPLYCVPRTAAGRNPVRGSIRLGFPGHCGSGVSRT